MEEDEEASAFDDQDMEFDNDDDQVVGDDEVVGADEFLADDEEEAVDDLQGFSQDAVATDYMDEETRMIAIGLASHDQGELLAALEAMQKAVIGSAGERVLVSYVLASPHCAELMGVWEAGPGAATAVPLLLLLYYMFRHPLGKSDNPSSGEVQTDGSKKDVVAVKLRLDKVARSIVRNRMKDIYSHLSSSQKSRQNVALLLLSAIVLRGRALAIEIATSFDFTLEALRRLGYPPKQQGDAQKVQQAVGGHRGILKQPSRVAFVELAVSFLLVGDPGLLRWILQKRPLWIGVLHGISKDDEKSIVRVLTLMQKKVMGASFMVPRGLQSVLFGDATLEQMARISADNSLEEAGELAYSILLSLCTDPSHGLCPENWDDAGRDKSGEFRGGQGRLLRLMLRLKVMEANRHRDLLLATSRAIPKLATLYLASIPLSLEPRVSPAWFNAMSLVSQLIPIASQPPSFASLAAQGVKPPPLDSPVIQSILLSLLPGSFSRVVLNRGLLHSDFMVKHACLRVLLEALLSLKRVINCLDAVSSNGPVEDDSYKKDWKTLSQSIQDVMRGSFPDPNTLMAILSTLRVSQSKSIPIEPSPPSKRKKGKHSENEIETQELQSTVSNKYEYDATIMQLWSLDMSDKSVLKEDAERLLHAKTVLVLAAYQSALPVALMDSGFDAFKLLPDDPTSLSVSQQKSLSALLVATAECTNSLSSEDPWYSVAGFAGLQSAYKKVKPMLLMMLSSEVEEVRDEVWLILQRVLASTGAFDRNPREILWWLYFLGQWKIKRFDSRQSVNSISRAKTVLPGSPHAYLLEFFSEAVLSISSNIYKYVTMLNSSLAKIALHEAQQPRGLKRAATEGVIGPEFGPFVVCILEKCVKTMQLNTKSTAECSTIALYVTNVLDLLLRYQVEPESLAMVFINLISTTSELLSQQQARSSVWTPLLILLKEAQFLQLNAKSDSPARFNVSATTNSDQVNTGKLVELLHSCQEGAVETSLGILSPFLMCVSSQELIENFPLLMRVFLEDLDGDFSVLVLILGIRMDILYDVSTAWPELFSKALELAVCSTGNGEDTTRGGLAKMQADQPSSLPPLAEISGLCVLLQLAPFSLLFAAATQSTNGLLLGSAPFSDLLQASLRSVHHQNWLSVVRLILSGIKHFAALSLEGIDIGLPIQTCFSLLRSLILPTSALHGSVLSNSDKGSSAIWPVYQHLILDLLNHPELYNMFMYPDRKGDQSSVPCLFMSELRRDNMEKNISDTSLKRVLASSATMLHTLDCHILSLLTQLLDSLQNLVQNGTSGSDVHQLWGFWMEVLDASNPFMMKAISTFQKEVDESSKPGIFASPALYAVSVLISYADPSLLITMFQSLVSNTALKVKSSKQAVAPHVLGVYFVSVFLVSLSWDSLDFLVQGSHQRLPGRNVDSALLYDLYEKVIDQVIGNPSIMADFCLLSFLQAPTLKKSNWSFAERLFRRLDESDPGLTVSTPLEILRHCVGQPNRVTGKITLLLVKTSPVHLSDFGRLLALGTADRRSGHATRPCLNFAEMLVTHHLGKQKTEIVLSDQDLLSLLPAACVYLMSESREVGEERNTVSGHISAVYAKFLTKQLKDWDRFVSEEVKINGVHDMSFSVSWSETDRTDHSMILRRYHCSPFGQIVNMLHLSHILHPWSPKVRKRLLLSFLPKDNSPLLQQNVLLSTGEDISDSVFEAVAKANIIWQIMFLAFKLPCKGNHRPAEDQEMTEIGEQVCTDDQTSLKDSNALQTFLSCLVATLNLLYKNEALLGKKMDRSVLSAQSEVSKAWWVKFLEDMLLLLIKDVAKELANLSLDMSKYVSLLTYSMTTLLGYRYGESSAMEAARYLTFVLFQDLQKQIVAKENKSPNADVLELLITHSKFLPLLLVADLKKTDIRFISGKHAGKGTALNSLSSVLSLVGSPILQIPKERSNSPAKLEIEVAGTDALGGLDRLELVKLLRILLGVRQKQVTVGVSGVEAVPLDEVLSILLAAYGATRSEVDMAIFQLMREIESYGGLGFLGLPGLDYLWGEAALKRRKEKLRQISQNVMEEPESSAELRRQTFREDLLIDPRRCGLTVLFFPATSHFEGLGVGELELSSQYKESAQGVKEHSFSDKDAHLKAAAYDPAFLLPFSLHGLSVGCISGEEFVRLGLLAVGFATLSSAVENMRKAGYDLLAKYYSVLEAGPSFKGRVQIRLLMTYVKNAITEPWQRVPAVFTVFAAEASCILMHPENQHYMTINRFLLRAPSLDLESIPLFQVMFGSGSLQYRSDRLWMLRLLAAGLQSSLDANVYRRKFVLELLMSFHDSSMADTFPRKWILQVLFQAVNVRSCARYLVEYTGCFSWLVSVAVNAYGWDSGVQDDNSFGDIACLALQVIDRMLSWGNVQNHFSVDGYAELTKAARMFYQFLTSNVTLQIESMFRRSTINIMLTAVRLSNKRRRHQTRFHLSVGSLQEVLQWVKIESRQAFAMHDTLMKDAELALQLVLLTPPSAVHSDNDKLCLLKVVNWALSVTLQLEMDTTKGIFWPAVNSSGLSKARSQGQESFSNKVSRWFAASVVLGHLSDGSGKKGPKENPLTCFTIFGAFKSTKLTERDESKIEVNEDLAILLLKLQAHINLKVDSSSLASVVVAAVALTRYTRAFTLTDDAAVQTAQLRIFCFLEVLLSELSCPAEINPSWQWSFNSPWVVQDQPAVPSDDLDGQAQYASEVCWTVLTLLQQLLSRTPTHYPSLLSHWEAWLSQKQETDREADDGKTGKEVDVRLTKLKVKLLDALTKMSSS